MRCMHEKRLYDMSSFLTLTYDPKKLPVDGGLSFDDFQKFMKRVRHLTGDGLRFYACGEYGEMSGRPHYHALFLNYDFIDRVRYNANSRSGAPLYTSKTLEKYWTSGLCVIGDVTFDSCAYVARYIMKKAIGASNAPDNLVYNPDTGSYLEPEFVTMSTRPGLGKGYYDKYLSEVYRHDSVVINGREVRPPRFYDTKFAVEDPVRMDQVKELRREKALSMPPEGSRRKRVREVVTEAQLKLKGRTI